MKRKIRNKIVLGILFAIPVIICLIGIIFMFLTDKYTITERAGFATIFFFCMAIFFAISAIFFEGVIEYYFDRPKFTR